MRFEYIRDRDVAHELDIKLRELLSICYAHDPEVRLISTQRYFREMPQHRYMLWDHNDLIAHIAVHEKEVLINNRPIPICGVADVCVHPGYRKQGLVKQLLAKVHTERAELGDAFSILFGDKKVYSSSGYRCVNNLQLLLASKEWVIAREVMVYPLNMEWPTGQVKLLGRAF